MSEIFSTIIAKEPEELQAVFNLRFQIYKNERKMACDENIRADEFIEQDLYDSHSTYCLLRHNPTNQFVGTARLVNYHPLLEQNQINIFPAQEHINTSLFIPENLRHDSAELSRFGISKEIRAELNLSIDPRAAMLELLKGVLKISIENSIAHIFAITNKPLLRILKSEGIIFDHHKIDIEFFGIRNPVVFHPLEIYKYNTFNSTPSSKYCLQAKQNFQKLAEVLHKDLNNCSKCISIAEEIIAGRI